MIRGNNINALLDKNENGSQIVSMKRKKPTKSQVDISVRFDLSNKKTKNRSKRADKRNFY